MNLSARSRRLIEHLGRRLAQHRAAGLTEYALLVGLIAVGAMGAIAVTGERVQELFGAVNNQVEVVAGEPAGEEPGAPGGPGEAGSSPVVAGSFDLAEIGSGATSSFAWSADNAVSLIATAQYSGACAAAGNYGTDPRPLAWSALEGAEDFAWSADVAGCSEQVCVTAANTEGQTQSCASLAYAALDKAPDNLQFVSLPSVDHPIVEPNYFAKSFPVTLTGFDGTIAVSVTGGVATLDGGPASTSFENVAEGTEIELIIDTADLGQTATMTVTAGSVTTSWSVTSPASDHNPENFWIAEDENLEPGDEYDTAENLTVIEDVSGPITITMLTPGSFFTHYGDAVWLTTGEVAPGDELVFMTTAPETFDTWKEIEVQAGDLAYTWKIKTRAPNHNPLIDAFPMTQNAPLGELVESTAASVTDFDGPLTATVSGTSAAGAEISVSTNGVDWSAWSSAATVSPGDEIKLRTTASQLIGEEESVTVSIGENSATWQVQSAANPFGSYDFGTAYGASSTLLQTPYINLPGVSGTDVNVQLVTAEYFSTTVYEFVNIPSGTPYNTLGTYAATHASDISSAPAGSQINIVAKPREASGSCRKFVVRVDGYDWATWRVCTN